MRPRLTAISVLLLTLSLSLLTMACSDDATTNPQPSGDAATAQTLVNDIVIPTIEALNLANLINAGSAKPVSGPADNHCTPLDICATGTAESCPDEGVLYNFNLCESVNTTVTGTVLLVGDIASGSASIGVSLNTTIVSGTISYENIEGCFSQTYNLSVTTPDFTVLATGGLVFCEFPVSGPAIPTSGSFTFAIAEEDRSIDFWFYDSETPGSFSMDIWDLDRNENLLFCSGDLDGNFECGPPTSEF